LEDPTRILMAEPADAVAASPFDMVVASPYHTVYLWKGVVWVAGYNGNAELGTLATRSGILERLNLGVSVTHVASGASHTLLISEDGQLHVSGMARYGALGVPKSGAEFTSIPRTPPLGLPIKTAACGEHHSVLVTASGTLLACGYNGYGELGLGHRSRTLTFEPVPLPPGLEVVSAVACGGYRTMAISKDGALFATGYNGYGELGLPASTPGFLLGGHVSSFMRVPLPEAASEAAGGAAACSESEAAGGSAAGTEAAAVACGPYHTAVVLTSGELLTCGYNRYGQCGRAGSGASLELLSPASPPSDTSASPSALPRLVAVAVGTHHTLALTSDGAVLACGYGGYGQLGLGADRLGSEPRLVAVHPLPEIVGLACGAHHSVVLSAGGHVYSTGSGWYGEALVPGTARATLVQFTRSEAVASDLEALAHASAFEQRQVADKV
jgi:hypothetical protein